MNVFAGFRMAAVTPSTALGVGQVDHRTRSGRSLRALAFVVVQSLAPTLALSQITYTFHNGSNTAYCGAPVGGPGFVHQFSTLCSVPSDDISVSDPGPPAGSAASVHFSALANPTSFILSQSGNSNRTGGGVNAVADCRDNWNFTITTTSCFTLHALLDLTGTSVPTGPVTTFTFGGAPGSMTLDNGTVVSGFGHSIVNGGHFEMTWTGTIRPATSARCSPADVIRTTPLCIKERS